MSGFARDDPAAAAFLADLVAVYRKHGLALGHEDTQGAFEVRPCSDAEVRWLRDALDCRSDGQSPAPATGTRLQPLVPRPPAPEHDTIRYRDDVARLRGILNARGFDATDTLVAWAYEQWSEDYYCAGWLILSDDDDALFAALMTYLMPASEADGA